MKKIFFLPLLMLTVISLYGQDASGKFNIGTGIGLGTEIETIGLGITGQYFITNEIAVQGNLTIFFPNNEIDGVVDVTRRFSEINMNGVYYFDLESIVRPYALAGINIGIVGVDFEPDDLFEDQSEGEIGLNLGGGVDLLVHEELTPFAQLKYAISDYDQLVIFIGVRYNFSN